MNAFDIISLVIEALVVLLALRMAFSKKKKYGYLIALTFAIYVFYDATRFLVVSVDQYLTSFLFLIASASILFAVWWIYKQGENSRPATSSKGHSTRIENCST